MRLWIVLAAVLLSLLFLYLLCHLLRLKVQMRSMTKELKKTRDAGYNKQITIPLMDRELTELAAALNKNLEYQKGLKLEAERSELRLRQSISDIAHDLRTPITVIKGNLQRISMEGSLSGEERDYLQICSDKTEVLKSMVDDFFELSFFESEELELALKRLDLTDFTARFLVDQEALIRQHALEPEIVLPEKSIFIMADEQLMQRIYGNLLQNIFRHTKQRFSLQLREEAGKAVVSFSNPVEGDERPDTAHIFDRTYRGNQARTGGGPGGLGLYIVRLLTRKQGGEARAVCSGDTLSIELAFPVSS